MISGNLKKSPIEKIRENLTDYDIYRMFCPVKFSINKKFSSPFRKDSNPSFIIKQKFGYLYHCDYGDSRYRGSSIDFVMQICNLTYNEAIREIDNRFGIGIYGKRGDFHTIIDKYSQPEIKKSEKEVHIECHFKKFTPEMHKYWNSYHLSEEYLKKFDVFQVKNLWIARKRVPLSNELTIAYLTPEGYKKIYRPDIPRKSQDWRFKSNIPFTYLMGKENIRNCQKSMALKSRKDELVTSLLMKCVYSVMAESMACFSKENVEYINKNSKQNYICFGSDEQAKKESKLITKEFGWKHYNTEDKYLPLNDIAEVARIHGLEVIEKHLKQKKIL